MAAKKQIEEEIIPLTNAQKCDRVQKLLHDAEIIRDYSWKEEFLKRALNICKEVKESEEATEEESARAEELAKEARKLKKTLLYKECLARQKKAERKKEAASTESDFKDAVDAYQDLIQFKKKHEKEIAKLSDKQKATLASQPDPQKELEECRIHTTSTARKFFTPGKFIFAAVIIIIAALAVFSQTASSRRLLGNAAETIGQESLAYRAYRSAYWRSHSENDHASYERCCYTYAVSLYNDKKDDSGLSCFKELAKDSYKDSEDYIAKLEIAAINNAEPGDHVDFGNTEWIVLAKEDGKALLHIKGALQPVFLDGSSDTTWENSCFRTWLNETYIQNFTEAERSYMEETTVHTEDNPDYQTSGGNDTTDIFYLLSVDELNTYYDMLSKTTQNCWWLRTPGATTGTFAFSNVDKTAMTYGYLPGTDKIRIKPTFWLRLQ